MPEKRKRVYAPGYDAPRSGYRRWTVHIKESLLEKFKKQAIFERKSLIDATDEAIAFWIENYDPANDD